MDNAINILAEKLGVAVEYIWPLFIKQASIYAISSIVGIMLVMILFALMAILPYLYSRGREVSLLDHDTPIPFLICITGVAGTCFTAIIAVFELTSIITALINPEFWALNKITSMIVK